MGTFLLAGITSVVAQEHVRTTARTYCNPLNLDYAFIPPGHRSAAPPHRSTVDLASGKKASLPIYRSDEPKTGVWPEIVDPFPIVRWDPAFLKDDDGRIYLYSGSSNLYPIRGVELDPSNHYLPKGEPVDLLKLDPEQHGWERFGEGNTDTVTTPYIEGAWMTKHGGRYYLQYAAPGREWNIYADGVYVGNHPLGPFTYSILWL